MIELDSDVVWSGGADVPFAMHSMIKPPVAWAVLSEVEERGEPLTTEEQRQLRRMITVSRNEDVEALLKIAGGLRGLADYYEHWGVPEMVDWMHPTRWGFNQATPALLAGLYGALATSEAVPESVRAAGFDLLRQVDSAQIWGATLPVGELVSWESLIKTGNYTLPDDDEESEEEDKEDKPPTIRMNSAAIWLDAEWQGSRARYVIAIMLEGELTWSEASGLQRRLGRALAEAVVDRLRGEWAAPSGACLRRALG